LALYWYRARWYDPTTGRFQSEDPMGFAAGDANFYRYAGNDPTGVTDPSGRMGILPPTLPGVPSLPFGPPAPGPLPGLPSLPPPPAPSPPVPAAPAAPRPGAPIPPATPFGQGPGTQASSSTKPGIFRRIIAGALEYALVAARIAGQIL